MARALYSRLVFHFPFCDFWAKKKEVTPVGSKENGLLQSLTRFENGATSRQFEDNFFSSRRSIRLLLGRYSVPRSPVLIDAVRVTIKQKSRDFPISKKVSRSQAHEESVFKGNRE